MASVESVKELILDEQKLVTYVSLSKELCIHINESKNLLRLVVDEIKEKQPSIQLNINFIVSGLLNKSNSARTLVCSENELDEQKTMFKIVFYQHIYSVSQGLSNVDFAALVSVNRFEDFPLCTGLIKSNSCTKRTTDEIGALKCKSQAAVDAQSTSFPPKIEKPVKIVQNKTDTMSVVKPQTAKSEPSIKTEIISPKITRSTSSLSNGKVNNPNGKKPAKGITGFFSKANSAPTIKSKLAQENSKNKKAETSEKVEKIVEDIKEEEMDVDIEEGPVERIKENKFSKETVGKKIKEEPKSVSKATSKNSLSKIKKTAKVDKKRKRVLHVSDSESEEDPFADDKPALQESDDEIPPTPSANTVKITSGILNPKKRRKVVDKTYTDEDGYILTRKEEVYESCSDDEEIKQPEVNPEKENVEKANKIKTEVSPPKKAKTTKKKISPPQKGKQATMMNFFKKI